MNLIDYLNEAIIKTNQDLMRNIDEVKKLLDSHGMFLVVEGVTDHHVIIYGKSQDFLDIEGLSNEWYVKIHNTTNGKGLCSMALNKYQWRWDCEKIAFKSLDTLIRVSKDEILKGPIKVERRNFKDMMEIKRLYQGV